MIAAHSTIIAVNKYWSHKNDPKKQWPSQLRTRTFGMVKCQLLNCSRTNVPYSVLAI